MWQVVLTALNTERGEALRKNQSIQQTHDRAANQPTRTFN